MFLFFVLFCQKWWDRVEEEEAQPPAISGQTDKRTQKTGDLRLCAREG